MKKTILSVIALTIFSFGVSSQIVSIPDANFKAYLVGNTAINTNSDTEIQLSEASAFTGTIECSYLSISDLTGIEAFTGLTVLYCSDNSLTTINVSNNTALTNFRCHNNSLTTVDVSNNAYLIELGCVNNSITNLNLSNNTALAYLYCSTNFLTTIDVSNNLDLTTFHCGVNPITTLDLSNNTALTSFSCNYSTTLMTLDLSNNNALTVLYCNDTPITTLDVANGNNTNITTFVASNTPNLTCIQVDDVNYSITNWTIIDPASSFSLDCGYIYLVNSIVVQGQAGVSAITTQGGTLQMEAGVLPANADDATYTWSVANGTGSASIDANGLLTAITDGTVTVTATANDISGITGSVVITISNQSLGINEQSAFQNLSIFPNPTKSHLTIDTKEEIIKIDIIDIMGKTVQSISTQNKTVDVSQLEKGIYFLQIQTGTTLISKKFVKE